MSLGAQMAAKRTKESKTCAVCGITFEGLKSRRYCGNTCAVRAYRLRLAQRALETTDVLE